MIRCGKESSSLQENTRVRPQSSVARKLKRKSSKYEGAYQKHPENSLYKFYMPAPLEKTFLKPIKRNKELNF